MQAAPGAWCVSERAFDCIAAYPPYPVHVFRSAFHCIWMYYATLYLTEFMLYYCVFECISQAFRTCRALKNTGWLFGPKASLPPAFIVDYPDGGTSGQRCVWPASPSFSVRPPTFMFGHHEEHSLPVGASTFQARPLPARGRSPPRGLEDRDPPPPT